MTSTLQAGSRVALAALLHDLGKLAERAGIEVDAAMLESHQQLYCPHHKKFTDDRGWFSHKHAAYTGLAWDRLEATGHFPDLRRDALPFNVQEGNETDSAINAAAAHHKPDSYLQWIIATADRVASGFERDEFDVTYNNQKERDNHYRARLLTLFEQIGKSEIAEGSLQWRYPLLPLSPQAVFPAEAADCTPRDDDTARAQYHALWDKLLEALRSIPKSHLSNLPLWLDHFDSLWLTITHAIPSATAFGTKPEVSLYDHSKAAAALAVALWRWHHETGQEGADALRNGWHEEKFLLVQGDFFGIQDFIFAAGGETQKHAHKLLRGRSFQVGLLADCAALKLLDALELPPTSQIINAAGKFLIVAPNTARAREAVAQVRKELNTWCLERTYGQIGVGIACTSATCNDFTAGNFRMLMDRLFKELDIAKHRRFDLCDDDAPAIFEGFLDEVHNDLGVCKINGRHPADAEASSSRSYSVSRLADDQIRIGEALTRHARVLVARVANTLPTLRLDYFGYQLAFVPEEDVSGRYGALATDGTLVRVWDFDAPDRDGNVWRGYARRFVNSYVPLFDESDQASSGKYGEWEDDAGFDRKHPIKTFHHLACEDRRPDAQGNWQHAQGEIALVGLKGDIDNLGKLFQQGLEKPTFAKMASLSRQVHAFFALWLPWYCEYGDDEKGVRRFRNTYTVFAGGDDFFLIGPWESSLTLASAMRKHFADYVRNDGITYSAGMVVVQPKVPLRHLARATENALDLAKAHVDADGIDQRQARKNAAALWGQSVSWNNWFELMHTRRAALEDLMQRAESHDAEFSTGLTYALLQLSDRAASQDPRNSIWRSQLHYRLARFFRDRVRGNEERKDQRTKLLADAIAEIGGALNRHKGGYRLPLSVMLYRRRE